MSGLLKSDLLKLRKSGTFRVCVILSLLIGVFIALIYYYVWRNVGSSVEATKVMMTALGAEEDAIKEVLSVFPEPNVFDYINTMLSDANALYISSVAVCVFIASEYSMGTVKNPISRGIKRRNIIASKFISVAISMICIMAAYVTGGAITSFCIFGYSPYQGGGNIPLVLLTYTLLFLGLAAFYTMISIIAKGTGRAIAVSILLPMITEAVIGMIAYSSQDYSGNISKLWIFRTILLSSDMCKSGQAYIPILVAFGYMFICGTVSSMVFRRQELK